MTYVTEGVVFFRIFNRDGQSRSTCVNNNEVSEAGSSRRRGYLALMGSAEPQLH
jgi:hypothetical protein